MLPLGQVSSRLLGSNFSLVRRLAASVISPLDPSTITLRASSMVAPTSAIRTGRTAARARIHSAPARVLPKPRPASMSHTFQPLQIGAIWPSLAHTSNAASSSSIWPNVMFDMIRSCSERSIDRNLCA